MASVIQIKRGARTPDALLPGELATNVSTGELFVGDDNGKPILVNPQARLMGRGVDFWLKVALGAVAAWVLLQIYERIGSGFLLSHQAKVGSPNITGDGQVGGFLDVADAAYLAWVKTLEALAALGTVLLIAMKEIWAKICSLIWRVLSNRFVVRHPVTGAAVSFLARIVDKFKKIASEPQPQAPLQPTVPPVPPFFNGQPSGSPGWGNLQVGNGGLQLAQPQSAWNQPAGWGQPYTAQSDAQLRAALHGQVVSLAVKDPMSGAWSPATSNATPEAFSLIHTPTPPIPVSPATPAPDQPSPTTQAPASTTTQVP